MPVVMAINRTPLRGDRPVDPPKLISVTIDRVGPPPVGPPTFQKAAPVKK